MWADWNGLAKGASGIDSDFNCFNRYALSFFTISKLFLTFETFSFSLHFLFLSKCPIFDIFLNFPVIFGHLYIITYASFRVIKEEVHRTPILERQSDSSYSIPLRSLRESNSMQTTVPSDYGYKSDDGGDADAPMYCIPVTPTAPIDDGFDIGYPIKSVHYEIPNVDHPFNDAQKCYTDDFQKYDPYRRTEHSDYKIPLDEPKDSNLSYQAYSYLHHNRESSYKEPEYNTHTAPESVDRTNDLYSAPSHNDTSQSNHDTNTSIQQDTCTSDNTTDTCAAAADNTDSATCD